MKVCGNKVLVHFLYFKLHSVEIKGQHLKSNSVPLAEYATNFLLNSCLVWFYSNFNKVMH